MFYYDRILLLIMLPYSLVLLVIARHAAEDQLYVHELGQFGWDEALVGAVTILIGQCYSLL